MLDLRLVVTDDPVADRPQKITCPPEIHKARLGKLDHTQSLAVYPTNLHCYGCHFDLQDGVDALALLLKVDRETARSQVSKYSSETVDAYRERAAAEANADPLPGSLALIYHHVLNWGRRKERLDWLYARGLNDYAIRDEFMLGHDGRRFVLPVYSASGDLVTLRYRRDDLYDDQGPKYSGMKGRNGLYLYPEWLVADSALDYLTVVEGEFDAMRLWQEGIPAITPTNGAGQVRKLPAMIRERFPHIKGLVIATDQDEPGQAAALETDRAAKELGFSTMTMRWEEGKDVTEHLAFIGGIGNSNQFSDLARRGRS